MRIHIVKEGDTLYFLSKKYNVSLEKIISANPEIANPNQLTIGTKVKIPSAPVATQPGGSILHQHKVVQGDSLWKLSKAWGVSLQDMIAVNPQLKNPNALIVGETVFIPSGSSSTPKLTTEIMQEGSPITPATGTQVHTGKKNTAPMPNYPQLPELPEMPEMPVLPKAEITKPKPPKAEITKPKPIPPKEEMTKPEPELPKEEVKKPILEPIAKPEVKPIAPPPSKPLPLPVPKPEMIKPTPLPVPIPPLKKTEYEPKKEEYYSKKEDCMSEYIHPFQYPAYDKGMYGGNAGYQGYQNPYQQPVEYGYVNDKKQDYPQPLPYTLLPQSVQNTPYQSGKGGEVGQQPHTTYEQGGYIVNYALVDVPSYGGDCGCGHTKPLPYSYMQAEADWKAATAQNAQPMLHPQAYGHNPQYTNYFRPTEYGVQPPYYNPNYQNDYGQTSFQAKTIQTSEQNSAELPQEPIVDLDGLNQLPILEEEKAIQKSKAVTKSNKVKKAAVSSDKRNKAPSNNNQASRQGRARKERRNPWIKR
ncbi:LysM peptidoglycan-binding domain-containing protein [Paenibacillus sp. An7]|uniref:LysM peptidoglycan-binding domain-containing protein n=1 Tax=Paenibacillus sp. An7 TaxID=2689577 RepID=UPI0013580071|nr:LysM peptidoglycan-binding domain-containing protein [Paenibacillus sp. An7]